MSMIATEILTAFIRTNTDLDDIDRIIAMSAYMAKRLELDMMKPIERLEAEVWPQPEASPEGSEAHDTDI